MTEEMTPEEIAKAAAMYASDLVALGQNLLMPLEATMMHNGWRAEDCAFMWRVIASAALENARKLDAAP